MSKTKTPAAQAAAMIRKELKKNGIKATVRSKNFSMGSSVDINVTDLMPATVKKIEMFCNRFQHGHFDGMQDLYEMSNTRDDIPQAKFVHVNTKFSADMIQKAWDWLRKMHANFDDMPAMYEDAKFMRNDIGDSVYHEVYRVLNGSDYYCDFWTQFKPRVTV